MASHEREYDPVGTEWTDEHDNDTDTDEDVTPDFTGFANDEVSGDELYHDYAVAKARWRAWSGKPPRWRRPAGKG
eukprot:763340-Lingulodinium_polyedra.AAC.1